PSVDCPSLGAFYSPRKEVLSAPTALQRKTELSHQLSTNGGLTLGMHKLRPLYVAAAKPASAQPLTSFVSCSIAAPFKVSETGGLASCSRFRTKMRHCPTSQTAAVIRVR